MVDGLGVHGIDYAHVIRNLTVMWQQVADPLRDSLEQINVDDLSPKEALDLLYHLIEKI